MFSSRCSAIGLSSWMKDALLRSGLRFRCRPYHDDCFGMSSRIILMVSSLSNNLPIQQKQNENSCTNFRDATAATATTVRPADMNQKVIPERLLWSAIRSFCSSGWGKANRGEADANRWRRRTVAESDWFTGLELCLDDLVCLGTLQIFVPPETQKQKVFQRTLVYWMCCLMQKCMNSQRWRSPSNHRNEAFQDEICLFSQFLV